MTDRPKVAVVDDEPAVRMTIRAVLHGRCIVVVEAGDREAALQLFADDASIRLLICDINMPTGNGPALVAEIRSRRPNLPVLYVSGTFADEAPNGAIRRDDRTDFLAKPFSVDDLLARTSGLLERSAGQHIGA